MRYWLLAAVLLLSGAARADEYDKRREVNRASIQQALDEASVGAKQGAALSAGGAAAESQAPHLHAPRGFGGQRKGRPAERIPAGPDRRPADRVEGDLVFVVTWFVVEPGFSFVRDAKVEIDGKPAHSAFSPANARRWTGFADDDWKGAVAGAADASKPHVVVFRAAAGTSREMTVTFRYDGHGHADMVSSAPGCSDLPDKTIVTRREGRTVFRGGVSNDGHCPFVSSGRSRTGRADSRFQ